MSEFEFVLGEYFTEWSSLLISNICHTCNLPPDEIRTNYTNLGKTKELKNLGILASDGYDHYKESDPETTRRDFDAVCAIFLNFANHPTYVSIFSKLITITRLSFSNFVSVSPNGHKNGMHTGDLTDAKELTPLESFECDVFKFLSNFYAGADHFDTKRSKKGGDDEKDEVSELVPILFSFMNADEPNAVRKSAGNIIAALSESVSCCSTICDTFWKQFGHCRKDIDFRIFATWVDGIMNLHFSFGSGERAEQAMQFLRTFANFAKKIDRGVLRSKFLDAIISIATRLSGGRSRDDYRKVISDIWTIATTWSKKGKHTAFCYKFLCQLLQVSDFLFNDNAAEFAKKLSKEAKGGDMEFLELLPLFAKAFPSNVDESVISDYFNNIFLGNLVGTKPEKRSCRFKLDNQIEQVIMFFTEIGNKAPEVMTLFANSLFKVEKPSEDHKFVEKMVLKALAEMNFFKSPTTCYTFLNKPIADIIFNNVEETPLAIKLFPAIRGDNAVEIDPVARKIFRYIGTYPEAEDAIYRFIKSCVSMSQNLLTAFYFMESSFNDIKMLTKLGESFSAAIESSIKNSSKNIYEGAIIDFKDWIDFRVSLDTHLLDRALSGDEETLNCLRVFNSESIHALDKDYVTLSQLIEPQGRTDIVAKANEITPEYGSLFIAEIIKGDISKYSPKFLVFASTIAKEGNKENTQYVDDLLDAVIENPELAVAFSTLPSVHWLKVLGTQTDIALENNWQEFCSVIYFISSQSGFTEVVKSDESIAQLFAVNIEKWLRYEPNSAIDEKAFNIFEAFCRGGSTVVPLLHGGDNDALIKEVTTKSKDGSETILVALFDALSEFFKNAKLQSEETISFFLDWVTELSLQRCSIEVIQKRIVSMLTSFVSADPRMIKQVFRASLSSKAEAAVNYILAIGNVFIEKDFEKKYKFGRAVVIASIIAHIDNPSPFCRQAEMKIVCLSGQKNFYKGDCLEADIPITSENTTGYVMQAKNFIRYIAENAKTNDCVNAINLLVEFFALIEDQKRVLPNIAIVIERVTGDERTLSKLLELTSKVQISDTLVAGAVQRLWSRYIDVADSQHIVEEVFKYGLSHPRKSPEMIASTIVLADIFDIKPREVAGLLIQQLLKYDIKAPKSADKFLKFINDQTVVFDVQDNEVIAACALSQILLELDDEEIYKKYFLPFIAPLTFFAIIQYHVDDLDIPGFHPLLDSILDASLLRLGNADAFTENLEVLQSSNLIRRASSIVPQFSIELEAPVKQILSLDREAIYSIADLMTQVDKDFFYDLFEISFANAVKAKPSERSIEPLTLLMGLCQQLNSRSIYLIILFALNSLKQNVKDVLYTVVDILHGRMMSESIPIDNFKVEVLPILYTLILMLATDLNPSFHTNVAKAVTDIVSKVHKLELMKEVSTNFVAFLNSYASDEYIASLFLSFINNVTSFSDERVLVAAKTLLSLSCLVRETSDYGFIYLFGTLIDQTRVFLGKAVDKEVPSFSEFEYSSVDELIKTIFENETLRTPQHSLFIVKYALALATQFKSRDKFLHCIALQIITSVVEYGRLELNSEELTEIARSVFLISMSDEEYVKEFGSKCVKAVVGLETERATIDPRAFNILDLSIVFSEETRSKYGDWRKETVHCVDKKCFPELVMFRSVEVVDQLISMITDFLPPLSEEEEEDERPQQIFAQQKIEAPVVKKDIEEEEVNEDSSSDNEVSQEETIQEEIPEKVPAKPAKVVQELQTASEQIFGNDESDIQLDYDEEDSFSEDAQKNFEGLIFKGNEEEPEKEVQETQIADEDINKGFNQNGSSNSDSDLFLSYDSEDEEFTN